MGYQKAVSALRVEWRITFEGTLSFPYNVNKDFVPLMQITLPRFGKATGRPGSEQTYEARNTQMLEKFQ